MKSEDRNDVMPPEARSGNRYEVPVNNPKLKHMLAARTCDDGSANEVPLQKHHVELPVKPESYDERDSSKNEISPKISASIVRSGKASGPVKEEIQVSMTSYDARLIELHFPIAFSWINIINTLLKNYLVLLIRSNVLLNRLKYGDTNIFRLTMTSTSIVLVFCARNRIIDG